MPDDLIRRQVEEAMTRAGGLPADAGPAAQADPSQQAVTLVGAALVIPPELAEVFVEVHPGTGIEPVRVTFTRRPEWAYLQVVTRFAWIGGPMLSSAVVLLDPHGLVMDCRSLYQAAQ